MSFMFDEQAVSRATNPRVRLLRQIFLDRGITKEEFSRLFDVHMIATSRDKDGNAFVYRNNLFRLLLNDDYLTARNWWHIMSNILGLSHKELAQAVLLAQAKIPSNDVIHDIFDVPADAMRLFLEAVVVKTKPSPTEDSAEDVRVTLNLGDLVVLEAAAQTVTGQVRVHAGNRVKASAQIDGWVFVTPCGQNHSGRPYAISVGV